MTIPPAARHQVERFREIFAAPKAKPRRQGEGALSDAIREALALTCPDLLLMRNAQCAVVKSNRMVRGGLGNGSADLVGVLRPSGRWVALEVKVPGEIPTTDDLLRAHNRGARATAAQRHMMAQRVWLEDVRAFGGFAAYVSSVEEARAAIARARTGASS
ncbi:MAG TPA: hypothetical protein VLS49_01175 [Usitatibacter sp.]|nr:hypothetical protein [Usitatibacter sp.]